MKSYWLYQNSKNEFQRINKKEVNWAIPESSEQQESRPKVMEVIRVHVMCGMCGRESPLRL
jgi:hypothetical protein